MEFRLILRSYPRNECVTFFIFLIPPAGSSNRFCSALGLSVRGGLFYPGVQQVFANAPGLAKAQGRQEAVFDQSVYFRCAHAQVFRHVLDGQDCGGRDQALIFTLHNFTHPIQFYATYLCRPIDNTYQSVMTNRKMKQTTFSTTNWRYFSHKGFANNLLIINQIKFVLFWIFLGLMNKHASALPTIQTCPTRLQGYSGSVLRIKAGWSTVFFFLIFLSWQARHIHIRSFLCSLEWILFRCSAYPHSPG